MKSEVKTKPAYEVANLKTKNHFAEVGKMVERSSGKHERLED
jgi:hypothetical protein